MAQRAFQWILESRVWAWIPEQDTQACLLKQHITCGPAKMGARLRSQERLPDFNENEATSLPWTVM